MSEQNDRDAMANSANGRQTGGGVLVLLGSLKFALVVVGLIAVACIAGTVIPQGEQVERYLASHPGPHQGLDALAAVGLTHVFYSWWFAALLCLLSASLLVCTVRRYQAIQRFSGAARMRVMGSFMTHVSLLLILMGGVIRVLWGEKGVLQIHEGQTLDTCVGQVGDIKLPFSVRLVDFELEFYKPAEQAGGGDRLFILWPEMDFSSDFPVELKKAMRITPKMGSADKTLQVVIERYVPDFYIDTRSGEASSRSDTPNNPAIYVAVQGNSLTNSQWVFARFPDFSQHSHDGDQSQMPLQFRFVSGSTMGKMGATPKAFRSTVEFIEGNKVVLRKVIAVNAPLSYGGYTFYQSSYNPDDLTWSVLQVVRDPGVPVVYAGFIIMMLGLTVVFCVGPYLENRKVGTGEGI